MEPAMAMLKQVKALLYKEMLVEWRMRFALNSLLLYVFGTVFIVAIAFRDDIPQETWITLFWVINLFIGINVVSKSFVGESEGQLRYQYTLIDATALIVAKMIYGAVLMLIMGGMSLLFFGLLLGFPFPSILPIIGLTAYGAIGIATALTLVSAIAAAAGKQSTLMSVLSFPVLFPQLLFIIKLHKAVAIDLMSTKDWLYGFGIVGVSVTLSIILFPFLWRE
jgi:heme exporter protein B